MHLFIRIFQCIHSKLQLAQYLKSFLKDTYPGAKKSPVEMVKMMAMPDIKPDTAIAGKYDNNF